MKKIGGSVIMKETIIKVNGMVCGGCENRVKNALSQIDGVENVEASFETGIVKVNADEKVTKEAMTDVIKDLDFEAEE